MSTPSGILKRISASLIASYSSSCCPILPSLRRPVRLLSPAPRTPVREIAGKRFWVARVRGSVIHDPATRSERAGVSRDGRHVGRAIARRSTLRARRRVSASLSVEPATWGTSASEKRRQDVVRPDRDGRLQKNSSNTGHGLHTKIWQSEARSARLGSFGRNDHGGTSHADAQRADDREFRRAFAQNPPERATAATHHLASRPFPTKITVDRRRSPSSSLPPPTNSNPRSCSCARARTRARVRASSSPTSTPAWRSWIPSAPPWYVPASPRGSQIRTSSPAPPF